MTLTCTKDVAVIARLTVATNHRRLTLRLTDSRGSIAQHVTVLTAAIDSSIDSTVGDIDRCRGDIGAGVEEDTLITHSCTINVTIVRVSSNNLMMTRHTNSTSGHGDGDSAINVSHLATTIEVVQDMSTGEGDRCFATNMSRRPQPFAWSVWIVTRTSSKHVAIECTTIGTYRSTTLSIIARGVGILVVRSTHTTGSICPVSSTI